MTTSPHPGAARRTLLTLALAGGLAVGGGTLAYAASSAPTPAPSGSAAATAPAAPANGERPAPPAPGQGADGRVTAVSGSSITVTDEFGTATTYALDSSTKVHSGPTTLSADALVTGTHVHVRAAASTTDGSGRTDRTAADVDVLAAHLDGVVASVSGSTVTLTDRDGFTRTLTTTGSTTYTKSGAGASASDVQVGTVVRASGSVADDGTTLSATSVEVRVAGEAPAGPAGGPPHGGPGAGGPGAGGPGAGGPGADRSAPSAPSAPDAPAPDGSASAQPSAPVEGS